MIATVFMCVSFINEEILSPEFLKEARNIAKSLKRDSEGYPLEGIDEVD